MLLKIAPDLALSDSIGGGRRPPPGRRRAHRLQHHHRASLDPAGPPDGRRAGRPLRAAAVPAGDPHARRSLSARGGAFPLVGVGGVHSAASAWAKVEAGATLIQLYSALVFKGPALVGEILDGLRDRLAAERLDSLAPVVGRGAAEAVRRPVEGLPA